METKTLHMRYVLCIWVIMMLSGGGLCSVYGADSDQEQAGLLDAYHASNGVSCADCHGDDEQRAAVSMVACLECHDTAALAETTASVKPTNPHENRHYSTEADCNLCHHQHRPSENFCLPCHGRFDFAVP